MPFVRFLKYIKDRAQGTKGSTIRTSAPKSKKGKAPKKSSLKGKGLYG